MSTLPAFYFSALLEVQKMRGKLPPVLFIQLDNCWRENKNKTMFGYFCWLVATGVFKRIECGFFLVGCVPRTPTPFHTRASASVGSRLRPKSGFYSFYNVRVHPLNNTIFRGDFRKWLIGQANRTK